MLMLPGSQQLQRAIARHHRSKVIIEVSEKERSMLKIKVRRFLSPTAETTTKPNLAPYWQGKEGRKRLYEWVTELYETEYRPGFALTWRLGTENINYASEETVCWAPERLSRLLGRNVMVRKTEFGKELPRGVTFGESGFFYRDLERNTHYGKDPLVLHLKFLEDRRDFMAEILEGDIGPHLRKLLTARVRRINDAIERKQCLDYI